MIDQLAVIEPDVTAFFLSLPRLIALFALIPFLGRTSLPGISPVASPSRYVSWPATMV